MPSFEFNIDSVKTEVNYDEASVIELSSCDFMPLKIGSIKKTEEGYLKGTAAIAKVGVMTYLQADGTIRRDFVPPETLFNVDSMKSLHLKPVTDTHPEEVLLDNKTVKRKKVGSTGETVVQDGDFLVSSLVITDEDAIANVDNGRQELSPGYKSFLIAKDGEYKGQKYDHIQIKRIYNHLATCDRARGGRDLRLNLDSVENIDGFQIDSNKETTMLKKYTYKGINYDAAEELIVLIDELNATVTAQKATIDAKGAEVTKIQAALDAEKANLAKVQAALDTATKAIADSEKAGLIAQVSKLVDSETAAKLSTMSVSDVKKTVIKAKNPTANLDGKDDVYVTAYFDVIKDSMNFDSTSLDTQRQHTKPLFDGTNTDPIEKARLDSENELKNAYKDLK